MTSIGLVQAQRRIGAAWCLGALASALIVTALLALGKYGAKSDELWRWFVTNVLPTTTLIVTVWVRAEQKAHAPREVVSLFFYRAALITSSVNAVAIVGTLLATGYYNSIDDRVTMLRNSQVALAFFQSLVGLFNAVLFVNGPRSR